MAIPDQCLADAAKAISDQLGENGIKQVGGSTWWQWRRKKLEAEWIEMRGDYNERKRSQDKGRRVMLYVHGGAYFFGSVDEHRYQLQRHARKLRARVFAPRYRLSPQYPFPCGLQDCLAAYMYLLTLQDPTDIILAGDSAGGGMVVSLLVTLRDRDLPLPAGAILISPWVDLTHSFPSVAGGNEQDYIPSHGFMQRPSASWPPPNDDEIESIRKSANQAGNNSKTSQKSEQGDDPFGEESAAKSFAVHDANKAGDPILDPKGQPSILLDGSLVVLKDQIQMYATNTLVTHPLISTVLQPSLGGLPPLLILTGGGEVLRDEQIYLAHKAANPTRYPPGDNVLVEFDPDRSILNKYKPTYVQLQVWDDLCHVAPTLSFTRPAKFMYRSIAQFGAWALARAQKTAIEILDDDDISIISSGSDTSSSSSDEDEKAPSKSTNQALPTSQVGRAGDPLPPFQSYMIRQRVDRHGGIYPLRPASQLPGCQLPPEEIGVIKPGPVRKWIAAKKEWDTRYRREKRRVQKQRIKEMLEGYQQIGDGETPPPSALAGRRRKGAEAREEKEKKRKSYGMMLWSLWGSSHDKKTMEREDEAERRGSQSAEGQPLKRRETINEGRQTRDGGVVVDTTSMTVTEPPMSAKTLSPNLKPGRSQSGRRRESLTSRSRSRRRAVTDTGQTESEAISAANSVQPPNFPASAMSAPINPMVTLPADSRPGSSTQPSKAQLQAQNKHLFIPQRSSLTTTPSIAPDSASILSSRTNASTAAVIGAAGVLRPHQSSKTEDEPESAATDATETTSLAMTERPETPPSRGSVARLKSHQFDGVEANGGGEGEGLGANLELNSHSLEKLRSPSTIAVVRSEGVVSEVHADKKEKEMEVEDRCVEDGSEQRIGDVDNSDDPNTPADEVDRSAEAGKPTTSAKRPGMYDRGDTDFVTAVQG